MSAIKRCLEEHMELLTDELKQAEKEYYATLNSLCQNDMLTDKNLKKADMVFRKTIIHLYNKVIELTNGNTKMAKDFVLAWGWNEISECIYQF